MSGGIPYVISLKAVSSASSFSRSSAVGGKVPSSAPKACSAGVAILAVVSPLTSHNHMSFEIGESVEVIGNEDGMEGSYFKGNVIDRSPGSRTIRYDTLIAHDGSPLEEVISIRRLRPHPPTMLAGYHVGDMVDTWHNEGWWVGRYVRREGENYTVFFENEAPENQHVSYPKAKICVHQEWKELEKGGKWKILRKKGGTVERGRKLGRKQDWKREGRKQGKKEEGIKQDINDQRGREREELDLAIRVIVSCIRVRHEFTRHEFGKHEHDTNFNSCLRYQTRTRHEHGTNFNSCLRYQTRTRHEFQFSKIGRVLEAGTFIKNRNECSKNREAGNQKRDLPSCRAVRRTAVKNRTGCEPVTVRQCRKLAVRREGKADLGVGNSGVGTSSLRLSSIDYRLSEYRDFGRELKLKTEKGEIGDGDGRVKPATPGKGQRRTEEINNLSIIRAIEQPKEYRKQHYITYSKVTSSEFPMRCQPKQMTDKRQKKVKINRDSYEIPSFSVPEHPPLCNSQTPAEVNPVIGSNWKK
ncbi:hypothetical protein LXL04_028450 [Taraxacum kok-saghyz]